MRQHLSHPSSKQQPHSTRTPRAGTRPALQAAKTTIRNVAEVSRSLKNAAAAIERLVHLAAGTTDLTIAHYLILVHLSQTTTCKQVDLKYDTGIAPAYMTRLLDELTERGLVRRHRSSSDRRQVLLALTTMGRDLATRFLTSLGEFFDQARLDAINSIGSSCEQFIATTVNDASLS
ncbi:MarR family winged helix-turn-helix transcriptional regulator [Dyella caseinilytica]|uniref:Winged helix-turn-helix transcriptional regulator n=1 Tax=Dyella caseinilytica TaxID=1849581 RepID=A0ABX7GWJ9_9GAMM|nr:MarR family winged helix-turn-helix transcriptional regulator [Dyella caseinilytica]QRN54836.1 winged helix-turn-helix transcriptional regulator [Dyella caseinilytica]GFZ97253.1 hypothetical protein GCM10011408_17150 [Dyella caseinilytica]